jgi:hypothetical protein
VCSRETLTAEPTESNSRPHIIFFNIRFLICEAAGNYCNYWFLVLPHGRAVLIPAWSLRAVWKSLLACYMPNTFHPLRFDHTNNILWSVQIMEPLINIVHYFSLPFKAGVPKLFWFKFPLTLKLFHAPPPSAVLGNQVTNCKKWRIMKIWDCLKIIYFWEIHCQ